MIAAMTDVSRCVSVCLVCRKSPTKGRVCLPYLWMLLRAEGITRHLHRVVARAVPPQPTAAITVKDAFRAVHESEHGLIRWIQQRMGRSGRKVDATKERDGGGTSDRPPSPVSSVGVVGA